MKYKIDNTTYLKNNTYKKFDNYERFNKFTNLLLRNKPQSILDVGCSVGQLIYLLKKKGYKNRYLGIDKDKKSINFAKKQKIFSPKEINFKVSEINKFKSKRKFDLIVFWGILGYFDDYKKIYKRYFKFIKKGSSISIFGFFNRSPFDTIFRYKDNRLGKKINPGFNSYSLQSHNNYLRKFNMKVNFKQFNIKRKISRNKKNPLNSYTLDLKNKKIIVNDLNIKFDLYHIIATKK
tara:strand:- start:1845 stop:2549 length:705 start_codon:yes stop_codon:yes gene_type:complete